MHTEMEHLQAIIRQIGTIDPAFPLQYALCLTEIARDEGLCHGSLAERTGLSVSTVSRIVGALSCRRQKGRPYGLVTVRIAPEERRRREIFLSPKGRRYILDLVPLLKKCDCRNR